MIEAILVQPREDRVYAVQPLDDRQFRPVEIGPVAHEALKEMMMRVDEAGINEPAGGILDDRA